MAVVTRPLGLRAGFHAESPGDKSGLFHAGEQWAAPSFLIREHRHPVWEIYLQAHGISRWKIDGSAVTLRPGHLLMVGPGTVHGLVGEGGGGHHFYYAAIDVGMVFGRHRDLAGRWAASGSFVHLEEANLLLDPFTDLVREVSHRLPCSAEGLALAVDRLVLETIRYLDGGGRASLLSTHPAIERTRALLDHRYDQRWTTVSLAAEVGLAPSYLIQLFTRDIGLAPHRYLLERRVERARELLAMSDLSVTAIAHSLGFASSQHLATTFRQLTGSSPSSYRRRSKNAGPAPEDVLGRRAREGFRGRR